MKNTIYGCVSAILMGATVLGATPASAQTSPWSVSFDLGGQMPLSGDVHGGGSGRVLGLPTQVTAKTYDDVYGPGFYWKAGLGYHVTERGEVRISGGYTMNTAERLQVGTVATLPLFGLFGDYKAFDMDFGYRQYLAVGKARPFIGGGVGFTRVSAVKTEFTVPQANVVLPNVDFFESSTVPAFGVGGGLLVALSDRFAVQGGVDFRWHGDLTARDGLAGTGLEPINDKSRRWAMPVTGGLTVRF